MVLGELLSKVGVGTPLHVIEDGNVLENYMKSATLCEFNPLDPDFGEMFDICKDREVDSITVKDGRLMIIVKGEGR